MNDLTGRKQLTRNIIVSWGMHIFVILAGFIVPRQISDNLGAEALGVWDLGWVTVRYLTLTGFGVTAALTRYVALYRAENNPTALSQSATAVIVWQSCVALCVALSAVILALTITQWVDVQDLKTQTEIKSVLIFLGMALAIEMLASPAGAIITGCHRWDIQHSIGAVQDFIMAMCMMAMLLLGGGLTQLAVIVFCGAIFTAITRIWFARRMCPDIKVGYSFWNKKVSWKMLHFGGKTIVTTAPQVLIFQTTAILIAVHTGPATLAIFNRGVALIRIIEQMIRKVATMFTPMTSGLLGLKQTQEVRQLLLDSGRYCLCATLPPILGLAFFGDIVLRIWMGDGYDNRTMLILLALGSALPIAQSGTMGVLTGLNAHGKVSLYSLLVTLLSLAIFIPIANYVGWSAETAAGFVGICWTLSWLLVMPLYLKRTFNLSLYQYFCRSVIQPFIYNLPLMLPLYFGREAFLTGQWHIFILSALLGITATLFIYWIWVLPKDIREKWTLTLKSRIGGQKVKIAK